MKNIIKIVFVIIGTLIGAGFASGQEIYLFFFSHGILGLIGIIISSLIIGLVTYKTLKIAKERNVNNYREFLDAIILNTSKTEHSKLKNVINGIINILIVITFFIMVAGFGAYLEQENIVPQIIGSTILAISCFIVLLSNVKGVVKVNGIIVPILILLIIVIGIINLSSINLQEIKNYIEPTNSTNFILDSILYASYNSILLIPVLITLENYIKNKKQIAMASLITTAIVIILSSIIYSLLIKVDVPIENLEMPVVYVVSHMFWLFKIGYGFIILGSIFTTSVSLGSSFLQNTCKTRKNYILLNFIICFIAVCISRIGFSNLVASLYPIFGYLGLLQIIFIFS